MLEEDGFFNEKGFRYINGRQKQLYILQQGNPVMAD